MDYKKITTDLFNQIEPITKRLEFLLRNKLTLRFILLLGIGSGFSLLVAFLINRVSF